MGCAGAASRVRRLCIDATNERFFATDLRTEFAAKVPGRTHHHLKKTTYRGEEMLMKAYLGNLLVSTRWTTATSRCPPGNGSKSTCARP